MSAVATPQRVYYDNEYAAHDAAREESKYSACGIYVREDWKGFYLSCFGEVGSHCYIGGYYDDELDW